MHKIGFIGAGNMAGAIISGIFKAQFNAEILVYDVDVEKSNALTKYKARAVSDVNTMVKESDYLVLAVKPQSFTEVIDKIKGDINQKTVIISIAAGINETYISDKFGYDTKFVQVMPNTPLLIGRGATAVACGKFVSLNEFKFVQEVFRCAGVCEVISADKMNEIIAVNGSTPAFIYEFARCFIKFASHSGIDENIALNLFAQTLIGSAEMMTKSGHSIEDLIKMVSSKGGTTIAGLEALTEGNLEGTVYDACKKCVERAYELAN